VVPVAMVLASPWTPQIKVIYLAVLGVFYAATIWVFLQNLFSEEKWLKASGFQELLDSINPEQK